MRNIERRCLQKPNELKVGANFIVQGEAICRVELSYEGDWAVVAPEGGIQESLYSSLCRWSEAYFDGVHLPPPVQLVAPEFRLLLAIEFGKVISYKQYAHLLGRPQAIRAVASRLQHNPYPLLLPCHRVVRSDGTLGGFMGESAIRAQSQSGGVSIKRELIQFEFSLVKEYTKSVEVGEMESHNEHSKR